MHLVMMTTVAVIIMATRHGSHSYVSCMSKLQILKEDFKALTRAYLHCHALHARQHQQRQQQQPKSCSLSSGPLLSSPTTTIRTFRAPPLWQPPTYPLFRPAFFLTPNPPKSLLKMPMRT